MTKMVLSDLMEELFAEGYSPRTLKVASRWVAVDRKEFEELESVLRGIVKDHDKPGPYKARDALYGRARAILEPGSWRGAGEGWGI